MKEIDVYSRYFNGKCVFSGVERRGALVALKATSDEGTIRYEASVTFFPHTDEEDYSVSYDAYACRELYFAKGRRSKKREAELMKSFHETVDELAATLGGRVDWDAPLREARMD